MTWVLNDDNLEFETEEFFCELIQDEKNFIFLKKELNL